MIRNPKRKTKRTGRPRPPVTQDTVAPVIGEVLREYREDKNVSQEALAHIADVDRTFVSQVELGKRQPTLTTFFKLADGLESPPSQIMSVIEQRFEARTRGGEPS